MEDAAKAWGIELASMRPRVFPAEDAALLERRGLLAAASMRPRVFPAEDVFNRPWTSICHSASMRPRVFPAEDLVDAALAHHLCQRFNEAAGIPRGRLRDGVVRFLRVWLQ